MSVKQVSGLPILGNFLEYRKRKVEFLTELRDQHGDQVYFKLGKHKLLLITNPEDIYWIEAKNAKNYVKATNLRELVGDGILISDGEKWKKQRKLIQPTFNHSSLLTMVDGMNRHVSRYCDRVDSDLRTGKAPIEISASLKRLVFEIVGEALFGEDLGSEFDGLRVGMEYMNQFLTKRFNQIIPIPLSYPTPANLKFARIRSQMDRIIYKIIEQKSARIASGNPQSDIVTQMMLATDAETGKTMTREQMRDEAISLLLAGFETTGHLLPWILYLLSTHQDAQSRLREEIDSVVGSGTPTFDQTFELPFLKKVVDETLRLYPPLWAWTKKAVGTDQLRGTPIEAGSIIYLSPLLTHRHPKLWEKPDAFVPDRWTDELREKNKNAFFPFGMGPRSCVGKHFAMTEIQLVVIQLIQRFQLSLHSSEKVIPLYQVTIGMEKPLKLVLERRKT